MTRDEALNALRSHQTDLRKLGVSSLSLFGSVARNEAGPGSDVDLFFDYDNPRFSLIEMVTVQHELERILGAKVDAITHTSLHPMLKTDIESSAIVVF